MRIMVYRLTSAGECKTVLKIQSSIASSLLVTLFLAMLALFAMPVVVSAQAMHQPWTDLLQKHVSNGQVDYPGFKKDEAALESYLGLLGTTDPGQLTGDNRLAFYINAYNAYTVKLILNHFKNGLPPESIKRIGGLFANPWKISFAKIGGATYSLDNIEHDIIRVEFTEPRIHFAVNCASRSCPPLIYEAYRGETLDAQLEKSTRDFLEDNRHNYFQEGTLYISSIFKWYGEDFNNDPVGFFRAHSLGVLPENPAGASREIKVKYLDYDWSLNGR